MPSTSQLNIKNPEARRLALELSRITGETMSDVVTAALRERLERQTRQKRKKGLAAELTAIADELARLPVLDSRSLEDMLYDEAGLPK